MKAKTIKIVLKNKFEDWLSTIEDETLRELVRGNTIITGGSIASMLLQEDVNDFDCYFRTREVAAEVARYYANQFVADRNSTKNKYRNLKPEVKVEDDRIRIYIKSAGVLSEDGDTEEYRFFEGVTGQNPELTDEYVDNVMGVMEKDKRFKADKKRYRPLVITSNAISLSDDMQLIVRFFGGPEEVHKNFDFVHCTCWWQSWDNVLILPAEALQALLARELVYVGSLYPLCSVIRTRKFIQRGWTINAGQYLKMCFQLSELNLSDPEILEDQLVGVDAAYFLEVIKLCKEKDPEKVDRAYLMQIIDRVF